MSGAVGTACGEWVGTVAGCLQALALPEPEWSWYEPRPGSGLGPKAVALDGRQAIDLHPTLRRGRADVPPGVAIDEARLFWRWGSLHVVDAGDGPVRWALWASAPPSDVARAFALVPVPDARVRRGSVLLRQDLDRFGLRADRERPAELSVQTVWCQDVVVGWTIQDGGT